MNKIITILVVLQLLSGMETHAQGVFIKEVTLAEGVTLEEALGEDKLLIDSLVLKGPLADADFQVLNECSLHGRLSGINMRECTVNGDIIPAQAFMRFATAEILNDKLNYVTLPAQLEGIDEMAFSDCSHLRGINFPKGLKWIGEGAFYHCFYAESGGIVLPEGLETIKEQGFRDCQMLEQVTFPSTLKSIGELAFCGLSVRQLSLPEGLESIGNEAFRRNSKLHEVAIPSTLLHVGEAAFSQCRLLEKVEIAAGFNAQAERMFISCGVTDLQLPTDLKMIPKYFFANNHIHKLQLSEGTQEIGEHAFSGNDELETIVIPSSVTVIGDAAFTKGVRGDIRVYCYAVIPPSIAPGKETSFGGMDNESVLYVPKGSKLVYEAAPYWKDFPAIVEMNDHTGVDHTGWEYSTGSVSIFDLQGRELAEPSRLSRGIYVVNGKKYVVD